jgi:Flp pilus assembly protein TadG
MIQGMKALLALFPALKPARGDRRGQAMVEYMLAVVVVIGLLVAMAYLLYALKQNGNRVLDLVASEYP